MSSELSRVGLERRRARIVDVDVRRLRAEPDDPEDFDEWFAEFGFRGEAVVYGGDAAEELGKLVADVVRNITRRWVDRYDIAFSWTLSGDKRAMQDTAVAAGVTLPARLSGA